MHALTALIKTYNEGKLGQTTASVNTKQTVFLRFICDLEFKNADFVFADVLVEENTLIDPEEKKLYRNMKRLKQRKNLDI